MEKSFHCHNKLLHSMGESSHNLILKTKPTWWKSKLKYYVKNILFIWYLFKSIVTYTVQIFFLIWIFHQTKNLQSPKTISYLPILPVRTPLINQKSEIWGNLVKISHQFLQMEREGVISFWKFWTVCFENKNNNCCETKMPFVYK